MSSLALRDHAEQILQEWPKTLTRSRRTPSQRPSRGEASAVDGPPANAAQAHGMLRAQAGFDINQTVSEYRALRASVLRLWMSAGSPVPPHADDVMRFNEAIDQALAESVAFYERAGNLFLGMLGHDMRTPLQATQLTANYLGDLRADEEISDAATRLIRSGSHMQRLLDDLVAFNRGTLGLGIPVYPVAADMGDLLEEELSEIRTAHPERRLELITHGPTDGVWDGACIQRLGGNLVANAIKYGAPKAPVHVVATGSEHEVSIEVRNQGAPVDAAPLRGMFDSLRRGLHGTDDNRRGQGLGLGLYIWRLSPSSRLLSSLSNRRQTYG
jgi:signal transduction histidine kinase